MANLTMDKIVALCNNRGFIFPGSDIYGGLANTWDYGPLGVEFKNNVKKAWWRKFVQESPYNVGMDCAILMNPETWVASGHVVNFNDPLMDCKSCKARFRADKLIEDYANEHGLTDIHPDGWTNEKMSEYIAEQGIKCPECGKSDFTGIRKFNMMFKTFQGVNEDTASQVYLRPETAPGIFLNFENEPRTTPRQATYGTREFEQMELEFFCEPGTEMKWYEYWKDYCHKFLLSLGMKEENIRLREHSKEELCHYSNGTTDIEFLFPFGWGELWGVASRTDYDLKAHQNHSGKSMEYMDPFTNEKFVPYCVEPSLGADRVVLAFLCNAYDEETLENGDVRNVLHLHPALAPYKAAVLPLQKNKLGDKAREVYELLAKHFMVDFDDSGAIGKRYRRQDEIGTPLCITIDFDTLEDETVTVRDRDTMAQVRMPIAELEGYIRKEIDF